MGSVYDFLFGKAEEEKKDKSKELKGSEESMMEFINKSKAFGSNGMPHKKKAKAKKKK